MVNSSEQETPVTDNSNGEATGQTPGQILQAARFERDLSEADIANALHLSRSVVQAIENDNYKKLPGVTFVRGYLRSYARYVNVSGDEVMEAFNALGIEDHSPMLAPVTRVKKQVSSNDKSVRWVTYAIILGLVVLVGLWWRNHSETAVTDTSAATASATPEAASVPTVPAGTATTDPITAAEQSVPVEPIAGNEVKGAVGNKNTSSDSSAAANEQANQSSRSEKVLNSDQLRDKRRRSEATPQQKPALVAQSTNLDKRLNMNL